MPDETEPEPSEDGDREPTFRDILKGNPAVASTARINDLLGDMNTNMGKFHALGKANPASAAIDKALAAARRYEHIKPVSATDAMDEIYQAQRLSKQRELEWRENLLEQQRLTVEALGAMSSAQVDDRRINVWVLRVAVITLAVTIIGVAVAVAIALLQK